MKLRISLQELGIVATNKQLTYEQSTFYSTLYSLIVNCLGHGKESHNINNAKKIIDLLVAHGLEQEIASSYHKLKAQTPEEVQQELAAQQTVSNLIVYVWFKYCQEKKQSIHLLDFEESNIATDTQDEAEPIKTAIWIPPEFDKEKYLQVWSNLLNTSVTLSVSAWSANNRILGATSNRANSLYDYSVMPYLTEIADNLSINSDTQEVALMKGVQLGATTGILENFIGYGIEHVSNASMLMVTATDDLAKERMDKFIKPMILDSKMEHRIISSDFFSKNKKSGATSKQMEWVGGGYLKAIGSNSGSSLRSLPIKYLLLDEVDSYPEKVGKDGDPVALAVARTTTFGANKKILYISTPLIEETSQIYKAYLVGDQRKYFVPCLECGEYQDLVFNKVNKETGEIYGLTFKTLENGNLDYDSVEYLCRACQHPHKNYHKTEMLSRGKWMPTAEPQKQGAVSYQISGLYSPASFKSWEDICYEWLQCWDIYTNKPKDIEMLQVFYNNNLGVPFREVREKLQLNVISQHKRNYARYVLPQSYAEKHTGQKIRLITAAVDVHADNLAVIITGWAAGRCFLLDYTRIKGNCIHADDNSWGKLWKLMSKQYTGVDEADPVTVATKLQFL
jgi:phage terminase large subunit GpA-like protein